MKFVLLSALLAVGSLGFHTYKGEKHEMHENHFKRQQHNPAAATATAPAPTPTPAKNPNRQPG